MMPIIDDEQDAVVLRMVYDGPPLSGKTTTLRMLSRGLGVEITTPQEQDGRTLYFDWVDYTGGRFEGRQIRCQIVSVPGQPELARRRRFLLETADVVVLVADTRANELDGCLGRLQELLPWCRSRQPPVGIVVQANKRDVPHSVPEDELRARFTGIAPVAVVETIARTGEGVREAFVLGVRLALDRIRALSDRSGRASGPAQVDDAAGLLEQMRRLESSPPKRRSDDAESRSGGTVHRLAVRRTSGVQKIRLVGDEVVFVPDPMLPGGFIWPPVDGRALLHEIRRLGLVPTPTDRGDWWASGGGWRFHSVSEALLDDADAGRNALVEWARLHTDHLRRLSEERVLLLAGAGRGRYRLWQLVRIRPALHHRLAQIDQAPPRVARVLSEAASLLLEARRSLHCSSLRLPCTRWTVGRGAQHQPVYVGLMPLLGDRARIEDDGPSLLERELVPVLRRLRTERTDYPEILGELGRAREQAPEDLGLRALFRIASAGR